MKYFPLVFIILVFPGTPKITAQPYDCGLEIYNPHFHNPALMRAEKTVQLDFIGYRNVIFQSGLYANAITTLEKYNSSAGVRFTKGTMESVVSSWNLQLAYAYHHSLTDNLRLNGGFYFNTGYTDFFNMRPNADNETTKNQTYGSAGLGVSVRYRELYAGFSAGLPLYQRREVLTADSTLVTRNVEVDNYVFHFLAGYTLGRSGRWTLEPVFALDYNYLEGGSFKKWKGYLGANLEIRSLAGIGFTVGNLTSLSASVNILERVRLMIGIASGRFERDNDNRYEYTIGGSDGFEMIGQIRINL